MLLMVKPSMHLQILLPFDIFADETGIKNIVVDTAGGSFGLLRRKLMRLFTSPLMLAY